MNHRLLRILLAFIPALLGAYFFFREVQLTRVNEAASNSPDTQSEVPVATGGLDARYDSLVMDLRSNLISCCNGHAGKKEIEDFLNRYAPEKMLPDLQVQIIKADKGHFELRLEHQGPPSKGFYVLTESYIVWYDALTQKYRRADGIPGEPPREAVPL